MTARKITSRIFLEKVRSADEMQIVRGKKLMAPRTAVDLLEQHILGQTDGFLARVSQI
jgi:hypothetical protein